jgi:Carboxypeptidase regulatory-like domain
MEIRSLRIPGLLTAAIGILIATALVADVSLVAQERFGGLAGIVTDTSKAAVPGATVTVTNKETNAVRTAVTSTNGEYRIPDLLPGRYVVSVELPGFQKITADDVLILLGKTYVISPELTPGAVTETVNVTASTAQIDLKSVGISHNVTAEELDRIPKTRTFQGIALTAPSVNSGEIEGGLQVNGASGAENSFTVDGVVTNSLINGSARQDTVFEYLQEVQVKTIGIPAEFGGALGGVVSAVTKSGGNSFRGEGHYYYLGSGLSAGPVNRLVLDPSDDRTVSYFQDGKDPDHNNEFGGSLGGPIIKDRLFFFGSVSPRIGRHTRTYNLSDGTGALDIKQDQTYMQAFGKVSATGKRFTAYGTVLYTPTGSDGTLQRLDGAGSNFFVSGRPALAPNQQIGFEAHQTSTTGNVDFWLGSQNFVTVKGGYFNDNYLDTGVPGIASYTYGSSAVGLPFAIPASLIGGVNTVNTPRVQVRDDTTKRGFFNIDYTHSLDARGIHNFKGGFGYQRIINNANNKYPLGYINVFWNQSLTSNVTGITDRGPYGYYEVNDFGTLGDVGANIISLYVQDQWTVTPRLSLSLGIRTENEAVPNVSTGEDAFHFGFGDKLAPRLGAAYDLRGDGKMKLYGSWGRYFDWTKYELARGSFGGDFWRIYYRSLDQPAVDGLVNSSLSINNMPGRDLWGNSTGFRNRRVNFAGNVDPEIKPMYQNSTSVGLDTQVSANTVFTIHYVHNDLPRTIEDIGALDANGDEAYVIGNPGEFLSQIEAPSGATPLGQAMPKAKRQYDALELGVTRRFRSNWFFSGNYTYSRLYGNYAGIASSDEIRTPTTNVSSPISQQQLGGVARQGGNANRAWDIDYLNWDSHGTHNVLGRLATDRPNVLKLYGSYQAKFGTQIGAFFYAGSGTPISTYVMTTDQIPVFVNGRGDLGRTPALSRTDILLSHDLGLRGNQKLRFELNVINVFNQKTATHIYNQVNRGPSGLPRASSAINLHNVNLLNGYDYNALIRASSEGANAFEPRFLNEDLFNPGTQGQFSVKFLF